MKNNFILIVGMLFNSILNGQDIPLDYKGRYSKLVPDDEIEIMNNYQILITQKGKSFIRRTYFPETFQLTALETFTNKKLNKRHGPSKFWYDDGSQSQSGNYINNVKDGFWTFGESIKGKFQLGEYINGVQNGLWKSYVKNVLTYEVMYVEGKKNGYFIYYDSLGVEINRGNYKNDIVINQTINNDGKPPLLKGCESELTIELQVKCAQAKLLQYLSDNVKYPMFAKIRGIQGRAIVSYMVEVDGTISEVKVLTGLCQEIKNEIISLIYNMPLWSPGVENGITKRVQFTLPIQFKLK